MLFKGIKAVINYNANSNMENSAEGKMKNRPSNNKKKIIHTRQTSGHTTKLLSPPYPGYCTNPMA